MFLQYCDFEFRGAVVSDLIPDIQTLSHLIDTFKTNGDIIVIGFVLPTEQYCILDFSVSLISVLC